MIQYFCYWLFIKVCCCWATACIIAPILSFARNGKAHLTMAYHSSSIFLVLLPILYKLTSAISTRDILPFKEQLFSTTPFQFSLPCACFWQIKLKDVTCSNLIFAATWWRPKCCDLPLKRTVLLNVECNWISLSHP